MIHSFKKKQRKKRQKYYCFLVAVCNIQILDSRNWRVHILFFLIYLVIFTKSLLLIFKVFEIYLLYLRNLEAQKLYDSHDDKLRKTYSDVYLHSEQPRVNFSVKVLNINICLIQVYLTWEKYDKFLRLKHLCSGISIFDNVLGSNPSFDFFFFFNLYY